MNYMLSLRTILPPHLYFADVSAPDVRLLLRLALPTSKLVRW
jgi:hypothetical protein